MHTCLIHTNGDTLEIFTKDYLATCIYKAGCVYACAWIPIHLSHSEHVDNECSAYLLVSLSCIKITAHALAQSDSQPVHRSCIDANIIVARRYRPDASFRQRQQVRNYSLYLLAYIHSLSSKTHARTRVCIHTQKCRQLYLPTQPRIYVL
jgi:hypothetical protein